MALKLAGKAHPETVTLFQLEYADSHRNQPDAVSCWRTAQEEKKVQKALLLLSYLAFLFPTLKLISNNYVTL